MTKTVGEERIGTLSVDGKGGIKFGEPMGVGYFNEMFDGLMVRIPRQLDPVVELRRIADAIEQRREEDLS